MTLSRLLPALAALCVSAHSPAAPVDVPHARVELVSASTAAAPGQSLQAGLRIVHEDGWHTYWKNPGDSGMPTRIEWVLPEGWSASPIRWPAPERIRVGPLANFGYEGDLLLPVELAVPAGWKGRKADITAKAEWLICKEVCLPGGVTVSLSLPAGTPAPDPVHAQAFAAAERERPRPVVGWKVEASPTDSHVTLRLVPQSPPAASLRSAEFFPDQPDLIDNAAGQPLARADDGAWVLSLTAAPGFKPTLDRLSGVLRVEPGLAPDGGMRAALVDVPWPGGAPTSRAAQPASPMDAAQIAAAAAATPERGDELGLAVAIAFAFAGGLILNLMPCVFPVVSIKVLAFAREAHGSAARLRAHGLAFAAGIVLSFWAVAGALLVLRAGGQALGWGFQLQSPGLVAALAALFFVLGLNLSGVFEWGGRLQAAAGSVEQEGGATGAFLGGLLATLVATPCTAPFMGAALGFALTRPATQSMLVFTALALGMAAPYVLLAFRPRWLERLPRPGRWMETLKQALAFPLYLTVAWLAWVLGEQLGPGAIARLLAGLVLLAAAAWAWQRFAVHGRSSRTRSAGVAAVLVLCLSAVGFGYPRGEAAARDSIPGAAWQAWSETGVERQLAEGRAVFVDFTAAWCVTCQVNKRVVLESDAVTRAFLESGVVRMRADWTRRDATITAALQKLGRSGVPVYALYRPGGGAPELLPEVLTADIVSGALRRATPRP